MGVQRQISAILKSKVRWFPELIEFYPRRMGESLSLIFETLSDEHFPEEIIHFVIEYFYEFEPAHDVDYTVVDGGNEEKQKIAVVEANGDDQQEVTVVEVDSDDSDGSDDSDEEF